ncbi:heme A synthase [Gemmatimonadetes bacterium T265]|nr:heme A synthase [Gemmatimonadetes bacterium T265]
MITPALSAVRRLSLAALVVAFLHIVFGAVVRITGSGMGCLTSWPRCADPATGVVAWFPPFDQPTLVIEWLHRLFAAVLISTIAALVVTAFARRDAPGVGGRGGVLRAGGLALGISLVAAVFGAVTVKEQNTAWATASHKVIAVSLLAALAAAAMRAGALGAPGAVAARAAGRGTVKAVRGATSAAGLALAAVLFGSLTAKVAGAVSACQGFPFCTAAYAGGTAHIQIAHRVIAYLLALHLVGLPFAFAKRREAGPVVAASRVALGLVALQIALGAAMVTGHYVTAVRSLHQANGVALWLTTFVMAYLARIAAGRTVPAWADEDAELVRRARAGGAVAPAAA